MLNPSLSAIGHWFNRRRALATGIACTAGGIGGVAFPLVIIYLAPQIGFAWSLRVIALICAVLLCVSCLTLRKRLPHNKPDGMAIIDIRALGELHFGLATLSVLLIEFAIFIPYTYVVSYAAASGLSPHRARMLSVILNASAVPGRALPGYVADRFGAFNTMAVTSLACTLSIWAIWLTAADSATQITAFTVLFGFWSGSAISLAPVCLSRVCRIEDYGKRLGTCYFVTAFAALIGVPIAGAIVDGNGGDYKGLIVFGGALYTASFIAFVVARGVIAGWRMTTF